MYRPTSLNFINWPNPVEPQSVPLSHPLNDKPTLNTNANAAAKDRYAHTLDEQEGGDHSSKRHKSGEAQSLNLPRLPVRQQNKRFRIPPTLSGLHQPPPNAGLLPSISVGKPVDTRTHETLQASTTEAVPVVLEDVSPADALPLDSPTPVKPKRKRWTDEETAHLLKGVARYGVGKWTKILNCPDYVFDRRTAIDLKDRFRVCCPDDYLGDMAPRKQKTRTSDHSTERPAPKVDRKSTSELRELGIDGPFAQNERRKRRAYTAAEDAALLRGFEKHGNSWAGIAHDPDLGLGHRKPTDLRDRLRTRYPGIYAEAGLAPRPDGFGKPARRVEKARSSQPVPPIDKTVELAPPAATAAVSIGDEPSQERIGGQVRAGQSALLSQALSSTSFYEYDDMFLGTLDDHDEPFTTHERITLDRGILDWPSQVPGRQARGERGAGGNDSIQISRPAATLNSRTISTVSRSSGAIMSVASALPSVADITSQMFDDDGVEQLPSLVTYGGNDGSNRTNSQFLGLNDLLSR